MWIIVDLVEQRNHIVLYLINLLQSLVIIVPCYFNVDLHSHTLSRFRCVICLFEIEFVLSKGKGATAMTRKFELAYKLITLSIASLIEDSAPAATASGSPHGRPLTNVVVWEGGGATGALCPTGNIFSRDELKFWVREFRSKFWGPNYEV